jgi:hypothetical protein
VSRKKAQTLRVAPAQGQAISAAQRKFNALIGKVEKQRQLLQAWQAAVVDYERFWGEEFRPLLDEHQALNLSLVQLLDEAAGRVKLSKADRATLSDIILDLVPALMDEENAEALKALHDRHSDVDFDTAEREAYAMIREALEQELGIELDEDLDLDSPEVMADLLEDMREAQAEPPPGARARRDEEARRQASQSVREVYRKLAGSLHPDRESDALERERKTVLMQRANQAYEQGNLLELLQLQLEIEQIKPGNLASLAQDKLRHFNRVLQDQHDELQAEVLAEEALFRQRFDIDPRLLVKPQTVVRLARQQAELLREDNDWLREDLQALAQPAYLKSWLKQERERVRSEDDLFDSYP